VLSYVSLQRGLLYVLLFIFVSMGTSHFGPFFSQAARNSGLHLCCTWSMLKASIISNAITTARFFLPCP